MKNSSKKRTLKDTNPESEDEIRDSKPVLKMTKTTQEDSNQKLKITVYEK